MNTQCGGRRAVLNKKTDFQFSITCSFSDFPTVARAFNAYVTIGIRASDPSMAAKNQTQLIEVLEQQVSELLAGQTTSASGSSLGVEAQKHRQDAARTNNICS